MSLDSIGDKKPREPCWLRGFRMQSDDHEYILGGAEEDRTPDLRIANATLSQLSYRPNSQPSYTRISALGNRG